MAIISVTIKAANDKKYNIDIENTATVRELKEALVTPAEVPVERQRLIYAGRVLKDEETLTSYKIQNGHSIHLVKSAAAAPAPAAREQQIPRNIQAGQGANDPLAALTSARFAGFNVPMPSASMFGPNPENAVPPSPEELANMLQNPMVQSSLNEMFSNPQMLDMIINSSPHLRNAPPYVRQMMQSPEFRRAMTDPDTIRQMLQMQQQLNQAGIDPASLFGNGGGFGMPGMAGLGGLGGLGAAPAAPGAGAGATNATGAASNATGSPAVDPRQAANSLQSLLSSLNSAVGGGLSPAAAAAAAASPAPVDNRPPEERYATQLSQLNEMGFVDFEKNVQALRRSGGNVQGAIEALLNGL